MSIEDTGFKMWSLYVVTVLLLGPVFGQDPVNAMENEGVPLDMSPEEIRNLALLAKDAYTSPGITARINDYLDKVMFNVQKMMVRQGYDPMELPAQHLNFSKRFIFITYHGEFDMTRGWLNDAATVKRTEDALITFEPSTDKLTLVIPMGFDDLMFNYKYSLKFMNLGPVGGIDGKIAKVKINTIVEIDLKEFTAKIDRFTIVNSGHIDLEFTGHIFTDWLLDMLSEMTTTLLHDVILTIVSGIVRGGLDDIVVNLNRFLQAIINPPTPTPAPDVTTPAAMVFKAYRDYGMY